MEGLNIKKINTSKIKDLFKKVFDVILLNNMVFLIFSLFVSASIISVLIYFDYTNKLEESKNEFYLPKFTFKKKDSIDFIKKQWDKREEELLKIDEFNYKNIFK